MSESSLSDTTPSDKVLERALRHAVQAVYSSGDMAELTVKRIRKAAEEALKLDEGFFKENHWKDRSKRIIEDEVEVQANAAPEPASSRPESPKVSKKPAKKPKPVPKTRTKRASPTDSKSTKRRKVSKDHDSEGENLASESEPEPKNRSRKVGVMQPTEHASALKVDGSDEDGIEDGEAPAKPATEVPPRAQESESEISEVLDDTPKKPKSRKRRSDSLEPKPKTANKRKDSQKSSKQPQDIDPDADEIKRLQGWLIKCGIRKMWYKELAPFDTPKAKIRHLKEMLSDAGMTGRFSAEKATEIREARELRADLEAVQAGNKAWGKEESEEEKETGRPRRRLAKGLQSLDFLNDDDGEETD